MHGVRAAEARPLTAPMPASGCWPAVSDYFCQYSGAS